MEHRVITLVIGLIVLGMLACNAPTSSPAAPTPFAPTEPPATPTSAPVEAPTEAPTPTPGPAAGWMVYTNEEAGISFHYPDHWVLEERYSSEPPEGWHISGPRFDVYTNFFGGFEGYELEETRAVTLASGQEVEMTVHKQAALIPGEEVEDPNARLVLVSIPDLGPSGLVVYRFDTSEHPEALSTLEHLLTTFQVQPPAGEPAEDADDWQIYSNPTYRFSFEYPVDWEIQEEFVPETAAGVEGDLITIILARVGEEDANHWIRINPRQFQHEVGTCREIDVHSICTYSGSPEVIAVLDHIHTAFETW